MPSGRTHDAITFLLLAPVVAAAYIASRSMAEAAIAGGGFLFGGLMFGPDLDTVSRQYSRWFFLKILWLPYRSFFRHRSRFSHGLILGALIRVIYFMGIITAIAFAGAFVYSTMSHAKLPSFVEFSSVWQPIGLFLRANFGEHFLITSFIGLWLGAASHTFTDMAGSFVTTGRISKYL
jgi:uncharacterized metal-binding protein